MRVVGIAGSFRKASLNRALLRAAVELAPPELEITIVEFDQVPLYNGDVEAAGAPPEVTALRDRVRDAQGLLIATPEYNYGVPGVLKNAIDWLSRPPRASALNGKPAGIIGASPGVSGSMRAQFQLRQAFVFTNTYAMLQPEVIVARAHEKFDAAGRLTDDATRKVLAEWLVEFAGWTQRFTEAPRFGSERELHRKLHDPRIEGGRDGAEIRGAVLSGRGAEVRGVE